MLVKVQLLITETTLAILSKGILNTRKQLLTNAGILGGLGTILGLQGDSGIMLQNPSVKEIANSIKIRRLGIQESITRTVDSRATCRSDPETVVALCIHLCSTSEVRNSSAMYLISNI